MAAIEHGPGMHAAVVAVLALITLIAGLVRALWSRRRPARRPERGQGRGA